MPIDVKLTGDVNKILANFDDRKRKALEIIGGKAESYAKKLCPVKTGNLRNSITHQTKDENTEVIGTNVKYAPYVELGHHQTPGRYVPAIKKRLKRSYVPGKRFMRPAAEDHAEEYKEILARVLGE